MVFNFLSISSFLHCDIDVNVEVNVSPLLHGLQWETLASPCATLNRLVSITVSWLPQLLHHHFYPFPLSTLPEAVCCGDIRPLFHVKFIILHGVKITERCVMLFACAFSLLISFGL